LNLEKIEFDGEKEKVLEAKVVEILSPITEKLDTAFSKSKAKMYGTPGDMPERYRPRLRDRYTIVNSLDHNITPQCPLPSSKIDYNLGTSHLSFDKTYDHFEEEESTPMLPEISRENDEVPTPKIERFSEFDSDVKYEKFDCKFDPKYDSKFDSKYDPKYDSKYESMTRSDSKFESKFENETSRWTDNSETLTRCNTLQDAAINRCSTFSSEINLKCLSKPPVPNTTPMFNGEVKNNQFRPEKFGFNKGSNFSGASPVCGESPMTNRSFWEDPFNTSTNLPIDDQITKQFEKFSSHENLVDVTDEEEH